MKTAYKIIKNTIKIIILLSVVMFALYVMDGYMSFDLIKNEIENGNSTSNNETTVKEIKRIDEYSVMYVDVDNTIDTTWVSIERKYIDLNIESLDLHKKIKIYENKTLSSYKELIRFRVKLGYKNLIFYKKGNGYVLDAGNTTVLSSEKIKDTVLYESGARLNVNDIKNLEEKAKKISCDNALTQSNIQKARNTLKARTIDIFKEFDNNVNQNNIQINSK